MNWFSEAATYVFSTVAALLPFVNPLSSVGVLVGITANLTDAERAEQVKRACIYMFLGLCLSSPPVKGVHRRHVSSFPGVAVGDVLVAASDQAGRWEFLWHALYLRCNRRRPWTTG